MEIAVSRILDACFLHADRNVHAGVCTNRRVAQCDSLTGESSMSHTLVVVQLSQHPTQQLHLTLRSLLLAGWRQLVSSSPAVVPLSFALNLRVASFAVQLQRLLSHLHIQIPNVSIHFFTNKCTVDSVIVIFTLSIIIT